MEPVGIRNGIALLPRVAVEQHTHLAKTGEGYSSSAFQFFRDGAAKFPHRRMLSAYSVKERGAENRATYNLR